MHAQYIQFSMLADSILAFFTVSYQSGIGPKAVCSAAHRTSTSICSYLFNLLYLVSKTMHHLSKSKIKFTIEANKNYIHFSKILEWH